MELESALLSFLRRKETFTKFAGRLQPEFFDNLYCRRVFEMIGEFFTRYPDKDMVSKRNLKILTREGGDDKKILFEIIGALDPNPDPDLMTDQIKEFIKEGLIRSAVRSEVPALEGKRQFDAEKLREALRLAQEFESRAENVYDYVKETQEFHRSFVKAGEVIPTGIKVLDEALRIPPTTGEEWIVVGPPGRGKTQTLLNIVVNAAKGGFKALYITTGDQGISRVTKRIDSIVSGIPWQRIEDETNRSRGLLSKRVRQNVVKAGGGIYIQDWSDSSCTPAQIEALLSTIDVDLVAVDYPDIMRPDKHYQERRHEISSIFQKLRNIAVKKEILFWCGSQANRSSLDKQRVTMADVAEDIQKAWVADGIITFCQTPEEKEEGLGRFYIPKVRRPPLKEYEVKFMIDSETGILF